MAQFRSGQRVRIRKDARTDQDCARAAGSEGVLVRPFEGFTFWGEWIVAIPGFHEVVCPEGFLEPLTDPDSEWADTKLAQLKRLVREPKDLTPAQLDEVRAS